MALKNLLTISNSFQFFLLQVIRNNCASEPSYCALEKAKIDFLD